jgi:CheY-like chemotaxis protein
MGIGLSLVKTLVEMHGGAVSVASPGLDEGSTFTVDQPLAPELAAEGPAALPAAEAPAIGGARILVVEDNPDGREMLAGLLEVQGYEVATAGDGQRALEIARAFQPQVVLLDLGLPLMDGFEVCRRLRAQGLQQAFILALTGWGAERDRARTADAGFDAHLTKPVEPAALQQALARYAAAWPRQPAAAAG